MKETKKAFTLIELLVVFAIIAIIVSIVFGLLGAKGCSSNYYSTEKTAVYRCIKTYSYTTGGSEDSSATTSKRVDVQEINNETGEEIGIAQTFECDDSYMAGVSNSATLYAQFEAGNYYSITTIGTRKEGFYSYFPLVKSVTKQPR